LHLLFFYHIIYYNTYFNDLQEPESNSQFLTDKAGKNVDWGAGGEYGWAVLCANCTKANIKMRLNSQFYGYC